MANSVYVGRSNYFKVSDIEAFKQTCEEFGFNVFESNGLVMFGFENDYADFTEDVLVEKIQPHLVNELDNGVVIFNLITYEKLRYVGGYSIGFNTEGILQRVELGDVYYNLVAEYPDVTIDAPW